MDRVGRASGAIGESSPSLPPRCQGDMRQSLSGAHPGPATHRQRPTSDDGTPRLRRRQLGFCHPQRRAGSRFLSVTPGHGAPFLSPVRSPSQQLSPLPTCLSSLFWGAASRSPAVCSLARLLLQGLSEGGRWAWMSHCPSLCPCWARAQPRDHLGHIPGGGSLGVSMWVWGTEGALHPDSPLASQP